MSPDVKCLVDMMSSSCTLTTDVSDPVYDSIFLLQGAILAAVSSSRWNSFYGDVRPGSYHGSSGVMDVTDEVVAASGECVT